MLLISANEGWRRGASVVAKKKRASQSWTRMEGSALGDAPHDLEDWSRESSIMRIDSTTHSGPKQWPLRFELRSYEHGWKSRWQGRVRHAWISPRLAYDQAGLKGSLVLVRLEGTVDFLVGLQELEIRQQMVRCTRE